MGSLQFLHRPRSSRYEMRGKLSLGLMGSPQCGQWEAGHTTDSRFGTRWVTTFKKLPTTSPKRTAAKTIKPCSLGAYSTFWKVRARARNTVFFSVHELRCEPS